MKKYFKNISLIICVTMIFSVLAACGANTSSKTDKTAETTSTIESIKTAEVTKPVPAEPVKKAEIEWSTWGNPGENKIFDQFTEDFNKKHEGSINIKFSPIPNSGYSQKILSSLAAGIAADVFYVNANDITTYTKENRLIDLKPMMEASETVKPEAFSLNIFGQAIQGDKIFGLVPDCNPVVIFYNTDMIKGLGEKTPQEYLDEGKWNRDAFSSIAKKAAAKDKFGFVFSTTSSSSQNTIFLGQGDDGQYFNPEGTKVDLDNPIKAEGLKWFYELSKAKAVTAAAQLPKGQDATALFASNQAAMVVLGRWAVPVFKDIKDFKWDIVPFPSTNDGKEVRSGVAISYICINSDTKNKEAAFTFIEEFCNKEGQMYRLKDGGNALSSLKDPSLSNIAEDGIVGHAKYFSQLRDTGIGIPKGTQKSPQAASAVFDALNQMFLGKIDADTCIKLAIEKANPLLEEANK